MEALWSYVVSLVLGGLGMLVVARLVPGMHIRGGLGSAIIVSVVYGLVKMLLQKVLIVVSFPLMFLTMGAFVLVINAFLLWITDKLLKRLEVTSVFSLLLGAGCLSLVDMLVQWAMRTYMQ